MNNFGKKLSFIVCATLVICGAVIFLYSNKPVSGSSSLTSNIVFEPDIPFIQNKIFGYSTKGKPIEGYEIGSGTNTLLLFGAIHGNEMGTADLLNQLIETIKGDPELVAKNKKLIIIPIANPDGYYDRTDKYNANGVNLNLNFDTSGWRLYGPDGYYAGPRPFSEVESQVLKKVVEEYYPSMMIAFHARGALVSPEAGKESQALARWYAQKTGYDYYTDWDYFGTATRWFKETKGHPAITVELTSYLESDWAINKKALLELISSGTGLAMNRLGTF